MNRIKKYIKEIILFIIFITIFSNIISLYKSSDLNQKPLYISSITTINDENYTLPVDKPILIHIWAVWCPVCKLESSNIQSISKEYEVVTIAVKSGSNNDIKKYLEENNLNFKVINDTDGELANQFNVSVFPTTIIYNKNREVVFSDVGYTSTWGLWLRMLWASY